MHIEATRFGRRTNKTLRRRPQMDARLWMGVKAADRWQPPQMADNGQRSMPARAPVPPEKRAGWLAWQMTKEIHSSGRRERKRMVARDHRREIGILMALQYC